MSSQIFKQRVPIEILYEILEVICVKNDKSYVLNNISFKKALFNNYISDFYEKCRPYYHNSKYQYLDKKLTYNSFVTVVRQICKSNNVMFCSKIKYENSSYDLHYFIYF
jgi:hypothetical protein